LAEALRLALPPGQPAAEAGLLELQTEIHTAIGDRRRLVYALRPPALDELGLAGALHSLAAQCSAANGLRVRVDAAEQLPPLPAAVEAADQIIFDRYIDTVRAQLPPEAFDQAWAGGQAAAETGTEQFVAEALEAQGPTPI
jgi:hypothetical protein